MGAKLCAIYNLALPCCTVCFWCCVLCAFYGHRHYRRVHVAIYTLCSVEKGSHLGDGIVVAFSETMRCLSIRFELLVGV